MGTTRLPAIAVADFKATLPGPVNLKSTFDTTLYNDLANAGIFDIVSKSLLPQSTPGAPNEINLQQWSNAPTSAAMVAFGNQMPRAGQRFAAIVDAFHLDEHAAAMLAPDEMVRGEMDQRSEP